jgi:hypothetical protein
MAKSKGQTDNTMAKSKGTDRQYNGQKVQGQIDNTMAKSKGTNNYLENIQNFPE